LASGRRCSHGRTPQKQERRRERQPCPEAMCRGVGRDKITVANGNHTLPGRSHRVGVTSEGTENAPRLRVTYGEDSKESQPPLKHRVETHTASAQDNSVPVPWRWRSRGARIRSHIDRCQSALRPRAIAAPSSPGSWPGILTVVPRPPEPQPQPVAGWTTHQDLLSPVELAESAWLVRVISADLSPFLPPLRSASPGQSRPGLSGSFHRITPLGSRT
jgi:hypothetical protein